MSRLTSIALLTTLVLSIAVAGDTYSALDIDNNGSINQAEASALPGLTENWSALDKDGNGVLSVDEFAGFETTGMDTSGSVPAEK